MTDPVTESQCYSIMCGDQHLMWISPHQKLLIITLIWHSLQRHNYVSCKARSRSAAFRRNCRQLATQVCSDHRRHKTYLRRLWLRSTKTQISGRFRATGRRWTPARSCCLASSVSQLRRVAVEHALFGATRRRLDTVYSCRPTQERSYRLRPCDRLVAVRRQSAHVASDPATDRPQPVAASCR